MNRLIPIEGCWVSRDGADEPGVVREARREADNILVQWLRTRQSSWHRAEELGSGFPLGMAVQDVPRSRTRPSLGEGVVVENRVLGGRHQVLVEFPASGLRAWLPFENLRRVTDVQERFERGLLGTPGNAERLRLRCLSHALELWNENTGALSTLDIDPLPHQVHLVHHVLASGNLNWMIAEDVGLGKTIEVGMLLAALRQRGRFRRILIACPAGLTRQWQEEMAEKFAFRDFQIYGRDFEIHDPAHWKLHERVIASVDRLKAEGHLERLLQADPWDMVVFDEAHRLSRHQRGARLEASDRFRLAAHLRERTDAMVLLTATPHQGKEDLFQALLELLRPELGPSIRTLRGNPEVLRDLVIRNSKAEVTDAEGRLLFQGKTVHALQVESSPEDEVFNRRLQEYLTQGYQAGARLGDRGRAIGFVMTTYRKLAASSVAAIHGALGRRRERLLEGGETSYPPDEEYDARYSGEWEERQAEGTGFFEGELPLLEDVLSHTTALLRRDRKLERFLDGVVGPLLARNPDEKLLVFSEYRSTQEHLRQALAARFGAARVATLHGSMSHEERRAVVQSFRREDGAQFLISTEAGGEGLNLHDRCHILANYDLPWNPMRLVQRVGRLYRYGQTRKVVVFNLHSPQTLDARIALDLYGKIQRVVEDLSALGGEFRPGLEDEILGQLADVLDVEDILQDAAARTPEQTDAMLEEALARAREAVEKQRELFAHAARTGAEEFRNELNVADVHLRSFVEGMCRALGVEILGTLHGGQTLELRLPEELAEELGRRARRATVTFRRDIARNHDGVEMLDTESPLLTLFLARARDLSFDGRAAVCPDLPAPAVVAAILRWQNDQGRRMRQELTLVSVGADGNCLVNDESVSAWLARPAAEAREGATIEREEAKRLLERAREAMDRRLGRVSNLDLHPEGLELVAAGCGDMSL